MAKFDPALEEEAVDRYLYAWVRTGEGLAPRRFSSQNFYVPGVEKHAYV